MSYIGGHEKGYESGQLGIGIAYTKQSPVKAREWSRYGSPVLSASDSLVRWWENKNCTRAVSFGIKAKPPVIPSLCTIMPMAIPAIIPQMALV